MRTAHDVMNRMRWDKESYNIDLVLVGVRDRFSNVMDERPLITVIEARGSGDPEITVPKHRIMYIKYDGVKVWDKESRTDLVFIDPSVCAQCNRH
jgi:uncharacterized protein (UPF0248 family)